MFTKRTGGTRYQGMLYYVITIYHALLTGVPPVCLLPGYPADFPGRVLSATGSGSDPNPAGFFGPGTHAPG